MVHHLPVWCSRCLLALCCVACLLLAQGTAPREARAASLRGAVTSSTCNGVGPCAGTPATLLIHGVGDHSDHIGFGCDGESANGQQGNFAKTLTFLQQRGWTNVYSLGYYSQDYFCGPDAQPGVVETNPEGNLYYFERSRNHCTNFPANRNPNNDGTWNEDDGHVACELAWYIWDYYTYNYNYVNIVAHSLGGVLLKEALYQIYVKHNIVGNGNGGIFPPYLSIHQVVTIDSPLDGTQIGAGLKCGCMQVQELEPGNITNEIHSDLTDPASKTVRATGGTNWTMEGDQFSRCGAGGFLSLGVGPSAFGMDYGLKISYNYGPAPGVTSTMQDACSYNNNCCYYGHGTYLVDPGTAIEVLAKYCINCVGEDVDTNGTLAYMAHSLQEMAWGINGRCGVGLASTATCDGIDPVVGGCNNTKYLQSGDPSYLKVYWSTGCSTNWASVSAPSGYLVTVTIGRSPPQYKSWSHLDGEFIYCAPSRTTCPNNTWSIFGQYTTAWYTDMLYAPSDSFAVKITTSTGATYYSIWH